MTHIEALADRDPGVPLSGCDGVLDMEVPAALRFTGTVYRCRKCRALLQMWGGAVVGVLREDRGRIVDGAGKG